MVDPLTPVSSPVTNTTTLSGTPALIDKIKNLGEKFINIIKQVPPSIKPVSTKPVSSDHSLVQIKKKLTTAKNF